MNIALFFALLLYGVMASALARWIGKFIEAIQTGGTAWVAPAVVLASSVFIGAVFGADQPEGTFWTALAYIGGTLALIQYGYEIIVKPVLALSALFLAFIAWVNSKLVLISASATAVQGSVADEPKTVAAATQPAQTTPAATPASA